MPFFLFAISLLTLPSQRVDVRPSGGRTKSKPSTVPVDRETFRYYKADTTNNKDF